MFMQHMYVLICLRNSNNEKTHNLTCAAVNSSPAKGFDSMYIDIRDMILLRHRPTNAQTNLYVCISYVHHHIARVIYQFSNYMNINLEH